MYWPATLVPPPAVEGYFSQTPLIIWLCEEFTACPVKCSPHLDTRAPLRPCRDAAKIS